MIDFKSKSNSLRRRAIIRVAIRRYSLFVIIPLLILLSYCMGNLFEDYVFGDVEEQITTLQYIAGGFVVIMLLSLGLFAAICIIQWLIKFFRSWIKDILLFILYLPIRIFRRIKDEKRLFLQEVEKEMNYRRY